MSEESEKKDFISEIIDKAKEFVDALFDKNNE